MSTSDDGKRGFHHGDLRRVLIETATEMVEVGDAGAVSLRDVARRAGVSHNAPYRHFPTREALLASVAEQGYADLGAALEAAGEGGLRELGRAYLGFARTRPGLFRLMFGGEIDRAEHPSLADTARGTFDRLRAAMPAGEGGRHRAIGAWALVHGLASLLIEDQLSPDIAAEAETGELLDRIVAESGPIDR